MSVTVLKPGLETTVQEYPGRRNMLRDGVPPSGPLDDWSFRLANLLVGNEAGAAALECQFLGPTLRFDAPALISVCGGDLSATLDGAPLPLWTGVKVLAGQTLSFGAPRLGARAYVAIAGGVDAPPVMGSRATYVTASLGGIDGGPLKAGQIIPIGEPALAARPGRVARTDRRPPIPSSKAHRISVVPGPKNDWITAAGCERFYGATWKLTSRSNRVGFRIEGGGIEFSRKAFEKDPENGDHPSNIIDIGYPIGGINWAGESPIILMHDCITLGGFIIPFTVPSGEFWKLAQMKPWETIHFFPTLVEDAQQARRKIDAVCSPGAIEG